MDTDLGQIVSVLPGLVWAAQPDGTLEVLNARWVEYTGIALEAAVAGGWQSVLHPGDLDNIDRTWQRIRASGTPGEMEARLRRSDGAYRWFLILVSPLLDAAGQVTRWYGINTDIEERTRAEEALRGSERQLRLIVDGLPALVSFMTPEGRLARANRHYLEYFGAPIEELKERGVLHSFHPDDRPRVLSIRETSLARGQPYEAEGRRRGADGAYRWFRLNALPLRDSQGQIVLWHLLQTDIDDQKRAEALLTGEKRLLEMVATGQPLGSTLNALCLLVQELCTNCSCNSILLLDPHTQKLWHAAAPSVPKA
jgi:PAS domain S-box-containing protein